MKDQNEPKEHTETLLMLFDTHGGICQSKENKFM
jgi:hypothetical protein